MRLGKVSVNDLLHFMERDRLLHPPSKFVRMIFAATCIGGAFMLRQAFAPILGAWLPFAFFTPAALIAAWYGGASAGLFALCLGLLLGIHFFVPAPHGFGSLGALELISIMNYTGTVAAGVAVIEHLHRTRRRVESVKKDAERLQREIAERKRMEEKLLQSEARSHELADAMPQIVWTAGSNGRLEYVNKKWFEYCGLSPEQTYTCEGWASTIHLADREMVLKVLRKALKTSEPFGMEMRFRRHTGEYRWHLCRGLPVKDESGRVIRWFATSTDIDDQKQIEQDLEWTRGQLAHHARDLEQRVVERTARLEESVRSLEGVLYHVAHDLRAPLRAMEGFTQILLESHSNVFDEADRNCAWQIVSAANRMDQLIRDLLVYGRLTHMEVPCRKINLEAQIDRALVKLENDSKLRRAEIYVERPVPQIWANPEVVDQILTNILSNALKFVSPNTTPRIHIRAEESEGKVRLWIQDNGIGIDETYQDQIFRVFERLEVGEGYLGTGIGLAIVRKGVERMRGTAGVESKPGKGSRFWVELPATPQK
jgi:PAS domain S-box-containing protein